MREDIIKKTEEFLKTKLWESKKYEEINDRQIEYRIEHSYRVAHIAQTIAQKEGLNEETLFVAALLHDIGYSKYYYDESDFVNHGRYGASIARPFLEELGYSEKDVNEMCYAIAIHVDDKADFPGERNAFTISVGDADNIDRFDAFRLYEGLANADYKNLPIEKQREHVDRFLDRLPKMKEIAFGTKTAQEMWNEKIDFQIEFYKRLLNQIENSK